MVLPKRTDCAPQHLTVPEGPSRRLACQLVDVDRARPACLLSETEEAGPPGSALIWRFRLRQTAVEKRFAPEAGSSRTTRGRCR